MNNREIAKAIAAPCALPDVSRLIDATEKALDSKDDLYRPEFELAQHWQKHYNDVAAQNLALRGALELVKTYRTQEAPPGFDDPHKGFVICDIHWQDGVEWAFNQLGLIAEQALTHPDPLPGILRFAKWSDLCEQQIEQIQELDGEVDPYMHTATTQLVWLEDKKREARNALTPTERAILESLAK